MANDQNNQEKQNSGKNGNALGGKPLGKGEVEQTAISLSQAVLSPLDAVFKAQLHGARSFLNMLLQLGYRGTNEKLGQEPNSKKATGEPFLVEFETEITQKKGKKKYRLSVPALSLVPIQPIAIQNAEYEFEMNVQAIYKHRQLQGSRVEKEPDEDDKPRPWYLVRQPVSIRGVLATPPYTPLKGSEEEVSEREVSKGSIIKVKVKVDKTPMPAGLSKMLTSLTEMARVEEKKD
jgi:hypothetical protein